MREEEMLRIKSGLKGWEVYREVQAVSTHVFSLPYTGGNEISDAIRAYLEAIDDPLFYYRSLEKLKLHCNDDDNDFLLNIHDLYLSNVSFKRSSFEEVSFENCTFKDCLITQSTISNTVFESCSFNNCNFSGTQFLKGKSCYEGNAFRGCVFLNNQFSDSFLDGVSFENCRYREGNDLLPLFPLADGSLPHVYSDHDTLWLNRGAVVGNVRLCEASTELHEWYEEGEFEDIQSFEKFVEDVSGCLQVARTLAHTRGLKFFW